MGAGLQFNLADTVAVDLAYEVLVMVTGERMRLLLGLDTVSDGRYSFIFCKYWYNEHVHPPYGVNCV